MRLLPVYRLQILYVGVVYPCFMYCTSLNYNDRAFWRYNSRFRRNFSLRPPLRIPSRHMLYNQPPAPCAVVWLLAEQGWALCTVPSSCLCRMGPSMAKACTTSHRKMRGVQQRGGERIFPNLLQEVLFRTEKNQGTMDLDRERGLQLR